MTSLNTMIKQLSSLVDTTDLSDWENHFVEDVVERTQEGKVCGTLSDKQVKAIERIWSKHFA